MIRKLQQIIAFVKIIPKMKLVTKEFCINTSSECEKDQVLAPCSDAKNYYCKLNNENVYECLPYPCSYSRPEGVFMKTEKHVQTENVFK